LLVPASVLATPRASPRQQFDPGATLLWLLAERRQANPGTHVGTLCDGHVRANATLTEHRVSVDPQKPFPASSSPFTAFDRWVCETATGNMQFTCALCCAPS
jgi:hypothetical protein